MHLGVAGRETSGRAAWLLLVAVGVAVACGGGCVTKRIEAGDGAQTYSDTSDDQSGGRNMKRIEIADGISVAVPANFPRPAESQEGAVKTVSYSLKPHPGAPRFLHFFEIRASGEELSPDRILADLGYEIGEQQKEEITVDGRKSNLTTTAITINLPCGSQEHATFYAWTCYCPQRKTYVLIATFTMLRDGFLSVVKSFRCT
jgi:hypothetical protein